MEHRTNHGLLKPVMQIDLISMGREFLGDGHSVFHFLRRYVRNIRSYLFLIDQCCSCTLSFRLLPSKAVFGTTINDLNCCSLFTLSLASFTITYIYLMHFDLAGRVTSFDGITLEIELSSYDSEILVTIFLLPFNRNLLFGELKKLSTLGLVRCVL